MQPRTGASSASSARITTSLYQPGKSVSQSARACPDLPASALLAFTICVSSPVKYVVTGQEESCPVTIAKTGATRQRMRNAECRMRSGETEPQRRGVDAEDAKGYSVVGSSKA